MASRPPTLQRAKILGAVLLLGACSQAGNTAVGGTSTVLGETFATAATVLALPTIVDKAVGTWECHWLDYRQDPDSDGTLVEPDEDRLMVDIEPEGRFHYALFAGSGTSITKKGDGTWTLDGRHLVTRIVKESGDDTGYDVDGVALDSTQLVAHETDYPDDGEVEIDDEEIRAIPRIVDDTRVEITFDDDTTWRCDKSDSPFSTVPPATQPRGTRPPGTSPSGTTEPRRRFEN